MAPSLARHGLYTGSWHFILYLHLKMIMLTCASWRRAGLGVLALTAALLCGCAHLESQPFSFVQLCDPQIGYGGYEADLTRLIRKSVMAVMRRI
jgi:hypothetical protein